MNRPGKWRIRESAALLAAVLLLAQALPAYEVPLTSQSVREAYFLGQRNDEKTGKFLDVYVKHFSLPEKGPYISEIELLTPYAQVVNLSVRKTAGYSAQQAEQDYKKRGDKIRVRVRIELTATYGAGVPHRSSEDSAAGRQFTPRPGDFWRDFRFRLSQKDEAIEPFDIFGEPTYFPHGSGSGGLSGAMVWLEYDAQDVASAETTMEVIAPDGRHVAAKFDLEKLR